MKFRAGDRVQSIQTGCNFNDIGVKGFIKRVEPLAYDRIIRYVMARDDGRGWDDHEHGGIGWTVREYEIDFVEGYVNNDLLYEVDE